ncbi:MAG: hypothetical protein AB7R55_02830 [Gemmatimonadales bacterium]
MTGLLLALSLVATADTGGAAYEAQFLRAAPGRLLELIELLQSRNATHRAAGERVPLLLRHSQGDQWDLLLLTPLRSLEHRFSAERRAAWSAAARRSGFDEAGFARSLDAQVAWHEELYVEGPPLATLDSALAGKGYFHLEIFQALAGKRDSLVAERAMENDFLRRIGRPTNLLFTKVAGGPWDCFTLGLYRDLQHYAEPSRANAAEEEAAARAAGFESRDHLGPYLRKFLSGHHDTLGGIVR